jgi:methylenetetrahydrofolate dehydrogenase (NADP+)/methenyltetrahydrofolate cyclohydrolase
MVGHSEIVGKPAAFMLMAEGATVTVCHHLTRSVAAHSRRADAVLVAVGKPKFLHADMVKPGAAVIDIGINQVTGPNGETMIVGDVDTDNVKEVASWVTPVPAASVRSRSRCSCGTPSTRMRSSWPRDGWLRELIGPREAYSTSC